MRTHSFMRRPHWLIVMLLAVTSTSCFNEPNRLNPLDPGSVAYDNTGQLLVLVENYSGSRLPEAWVRIASLGLAQQTNENGMAVFRIPAGNYLVSAELEGYNTAVVRDTVVTRDTEETVLTLNGLPSIENASMYTLMDERNNGQHEYWYGLEVELKDPDTASDLYDLLINLPDSTSQYAIFKRNDEEVHLVYEYPLRWTNLQTFTELLYKPFELTIRDTKEDADTVYTELTSFLNYPLLSEIMFEETNYPKNRVTLRWWNPTDPNAEQGTELYFEPRKWQITIRESVNTDALFDTTFVFAEEELPSTMECVIEQEGLFTPSSYYYWELSMFDNYGNIARSAELLFRVINDGGI